MTMTETVVHLVVLPPGDDPTELRAVACERAGCRETMRGTFKDDVGWVLQHGSNPEHVLILGVREFAVTTEDYEDPYSTLWDTTEPDEWLALIHA